MRPTMQRGHQRFVMMTVGPQISAAILLKRSGTTPVDRGETSRRGDKVKAVMTTIKNQ
jgi:hypothetical protein